MPYDRFETKVVDAAGHMNEGEAHIVAIGPRKATGNKIHELAGLLRGRLLVPPFVINSKFAVTRAHVQR